jgi:hypothetical protein
MAAMTQRVQFFTRADESQRRALDRAGDRAVLCQLLARDGRRHLFDLLVEAYHADAREELCDRTGIPHHILLGWLSVVDLLRVAEIGERSAQLLIRGGVSTVCQLARANGYLLERRLRRLSRSEPTHGRRRSAPSRATVALWIERARSLPPGTEV